MSIPVKEELTNVEKYLEIQKLRFGEKLHYEIKADCDFSIPPIIIQPIIENSVKHAMPYVSRLTIEVLVTQGSGRGRITITDSLKTLDPSMLNQGQGLTMTKKRVETGNGIFLIKNGGVEISFCL